MRELVYVLDLYCGWCYGFGPTVRELAADPEVRLTVRHGALFTDDRSAPIGQYGHIPAANARISALTGVEFGQGYEAMLAEGSTAMDSNDAARGLMALRQVAGEDRALEAVSVLQAAFYGEGLSLSSEAAYDFAAERLGVEAEAVRVALKDPDVAARAAAEQQQVLGLGVDHYPTLLAVTENGLVEVGSPTASATDILAQVDSLAS